MFRRRLSAPTRLILALLVALAAIPSANARNHHHGQTGKTQASQTSKTDGIQAKDVNDQHVKAASDDVDKILDNKIKNICRGC